MRIVLLGDSHLARIRRDLAALEENVLNAAEGGTSSLALLAQAATVKVCADDFLVVSVGTNDAAPWKRVALPDFKRALSSCFRLVSTGSCAYIAPPGVVESRLTGSADRSNALLDEYRHAGIATCAENGVQVVRADLLLAPLGATAFTDDGVHLNGSGYKVLLPAIAAAIQRPE